MCTRSRGTSRTLGCVSPRRMATALQEETPAVTITNQACGEVLIEHVNDILASQGKAMDQALQVTRHIVDHYEKQGRLKHLHDHLNDRAWIGKWVTQALAQNPTPPRLVAPATVLTTNRTTSRRLSEKKRARSPEPSGGPGAPPPHPDGRRGWWHADGVGRRSRRRGARGRARCLTPCSARRARGRGGRWRPRGAS